MLRWLAAVLLAMTALTGHASAEQWKTYTDTQRGFSISYPASWIVHVEKISIPPGRDLKLAGVAFSVPAEVIGKSDLESDTFIAISVSDAHVQTEFGTCAADRFVIAKPQTIIENGIRYSYATWTTTTPLGTYEQHAYSFPDSEPCIGVQYFIHSRTPLGIGTPHIDHAALIAQFDKIRLSLVPRRPVQPPAAPPKVGEPKAH